MLLGVSERALSVTRSVAESSKCYLECRREVEVLFGVSERALSVTWSVGDSSKC